MRTVAQLINIDVQPVADAIETVGRLIIELFQFIISAIPELIQTVILQLIPALPAPVVVAYQTVVQYFVIANGWLPLSLAITLFWLGVQWWIFLLVVRLTVGVLR